MRTINFKNLSLGLIALCAQIAKGQEALPRADLQAIFKVGTEQRSGIPTELLDGTYVVGPITGDEIQVEHYLMIESDINDSEKFFALMIPKPLAKESPKGLARLFQGRKLNGSSSIMLSPLRIDTNGNLEITSETQTKAPVLEISSRPGRHKYPYVIQGRNGAMGGQILGMRGYGGFKPSLKALPQDGVFVSGGKSADVVVNFPEIAFYDGSARGSSFTMLQMNGDEGKFSMMVDNSLDTIAESNIASEEIKRIAIFVNGGCFDSEVLITLQPLTGAGEFNATIFRPAKRSLLEFVFPGRRIPLNAQSK